MQETKTFNVDDKSHYWRLKLNRAVREATGTRFCTSCQLSKPYDQVKVYKPANPKLGVAKSVVRCDACQARRVEYMNSRKA